MEFPQGDFIVGLTIMEAPRGGVLNRSFMPFFFSLRRTVFGILLFLIRPIF